MNDIVEVAARGGAGWRPRGILTAAVAVFLLLAPAARAHEGGIELTVSRSELAAGGQVTVDGEGFAPNATVGLNLTGPGGDADLEAATTDEDGAFSQTVTIPGVMVPGLYLIRTEGGEDASVELSLNAMPGMEVELDALPAERERSSAWNIVALVVLLGVAGLGAAIARPWHRAATPRAA